MPGDNPILDGMTVGADGRLYVTDLSAGGMHGAESRRLGRRVHCLWRRAHELRLRWRDHVGGPTPGP